MGTVEYGCTRGEALDTITTNALIIMVLGLTTPWHVPMAYFLTDKLKSNVLCQLIREEIEILTEIGANVHATVLDGALKTIPMTERLCCKLRDIAAFISISMQK